MNSKSQLKFALLLPVALFSAIVIPTALWSAFVLADLPETVNVVVYSICSLIKYASVIAVMFYGAVKFEKTKYCLIGYGIFSALYLLFFVSFCSNLSSQGAVYSFFYTVCFVSTGDWCPVSWYWRVFGSLGSWLYLLMFLVQILTVGTVIWVAAKRLSEKAVQTDVKSQLKFSLLLPVALFAAVVIPMAVYSSFESADLPETAGIFIQYICSLIRNAAVIAVMFYIAGKTEQLRYHFICYGVFSALYSLFFVSFYSYLNINRLFYGKVFSFFSLVCRQSTADEYLRMNCTDKFGYVLGSLLLLLIFLVQIISVGTVIRAVSKRLSKQAVNEDCKITGEC